MQNWGLHKLFFLLIVISMYVHSSAFVFVWWTLCAWRFWFVGENKSASTTFSLNSPFCIVFLQLSFYGIRVFATSVPQSSSVAGFKSIFFVRHCCQLVRQINWPHSFVHNIHHICSTSMLSISSLSNGYQRRWSDHILKGPW